MDLERLFDLVEDAAEPAAAGSEIIASGFWSASRMMSSSGRKRLIVLASSRPLSPGASLGRGGRVDRTLLQQRHVARRLEGKAVVDHHRLEVGVEDHGERRVLERADEHRLVDELVLGGAPQRICWTCAGQREAASASRTTPRRGFAPVSPARSASRAPGRGVVLRLPFPASLR